LGSPHRVGAENSYSGDKRAANREGIIMLIASKEKAQGLLEYALILVLVAIAVVFILGILGGNVSAFFSSINSKFTGS